MDSRCLEAATAIQNSVINTLRTNNTVPDLGGITTTFGMAKAIAADISKTKG